MVAHSGPTVLEHGDDALRRHANDSSAVPLATFGDQESSVSVADAVPRRLFPACDFHGVSERIDAQQAGRCPLLAVYITGLDNEKVRRIVESDAGRKSEPGRHDFDAVSWWDGNVGGVCRASRGSSANTRSMGAPSAV